MKLKGNITKVEDVGGEIAVTAQVAQVAASEWYGVHSVSFRVRDDQRARDTYRIGRGVTIAVEVSRG